MSLSPAEPCKNGHVSPRRKSGNCIQCEKDRYHNDPKRKEYVKRKQAERREAVKADPVKNAEQREYMREYSKRNRAKLSSQSKDLYHKKNTHIRLKRKGIEPTKALINLIDSHCGKCDICGSAGDGRWSELNIDHCHDTNDFRGMLCSSCNRALGYFKDSIELLEKAVQYLKDSRQFRKMLPNEFVAG